MKQKKHGVFRREGNNLHVEIEISLKEALLGFSKILDHLDDHEVNTAACTKTIAHEYSR